MKTAGNLVVLGSINADHILNLNSFPTPGETVTGSHYQVAFGGKGANQAVAAVVVVRISPSLPVQEMTILVSVYVNN